MSQCRTVVLRSASFPAAAARTKTNHGRKLICTLARLALREPSATSSASCGFYGCATAGLRFLLLRQWRQGGTRRGGSPLSRWHGLLDSPERMIGNRSTGRKEKKHPTRIRERKQGLTPLAVTAAKHNNGSLFTIRRLKPKPNCNRGSRLRGQEARRLHFICRRVEYLTASTAVGPLVQSRRGPRNLARRSVSASRGPPSATVPVETRAQLASPRKAAFSGAPATATLYRKWSRGDTPRGVSDKRVEQRPAGAGPGYLCVHKFARQE